MAAKSSALTVTIDDIDVSARVRPIDDAVAQEIAASYQLHGRLFQLIGLRQTPKGRKKWVLVWGGHRLRALAIAGVTELVEGEHFGRIAVDAANARRVEIEENMARTDETPFARAVMLAAYRHDAGAPTGSGGDRTSEAFQKLGGSFTAHAMRVFDLSSDQVERLLRIGTALTKPGGLAERLHFSRIARNQSQLLKLSALPEEQLARAAEAFDAAKGDFFNLMAILSRPPEGQSAMLAKLRAGATLGDVIGESQPEKAPAFDHWQQAVSAYNQLDFKGRVSAAVEYWKQDEKAVRAAFKTLGYDLVKLEGGT